MVVAGPQTPRRVGVKGPGRVWPQPNRGSGEESETVMVQGKCQGEASEALWAFRLGTGWASDCRVQPGQTDAVDQLVAREANGGDAVETRFLIAIH